MCLFNFRYACFVLHNLFQMRHVLLLFLAFLPLNLFCQVEQPKTELFVKIDSVSFYSFGKTGVTKHLISPIKKLKSSYLNYSEPLPYELKNTAFDTLSAIVHPSGDVYFLYPGGGVLFRYTDGAIKRIDRSFPHRNQFSGYFFEYNNEIYLFGGYGYWKTNSLLTRFNFQTKSWDYIYTSGQGPGLGVNQGSFILDKNSLYVFDFYHRIDDKDQKNNNLYVLDLNSFNWIKKGALNNRFYNNIAKKQAEINLQYNNSLLQASNDDSFLRIVTPSENKIQFFSVDLPNINNRSVIIGPNIIYPVLSADRKFETLTLKNIKESIELQSEEYLTNDFNLFINYFIYVGVFCVLLIALTFFKFRKEKLVFFLEKNSLNGLNESLKIDKDENFVLELLVNSKGREIDNSYVLSYFKNSTISLDASVKRKNKVIEELNRKGLEKFELVLIIKNSKKSDSRKVKYQLNPVLDI